MSALRFLIPLIILFSGCSGIMERLRDRAMPYTILRKSGGVYLVKFRYRPKVKGVQTLYLVGTFNQWSCPGNDKGGRNYPMHYNKKADYWEVVAVLHPGVYHYMYVINMRGTVIDEKNIHTLPNGGQVSKILLYK